MLAEETGAEGAIDWSRDLRLVDRWMRSRLARAVLDAERAIDERRFSDYAELLYDLIWRDFCDWRLEALKPTIRDSAAQRALLRVELDCVLRLTHPLCPFVTEVLWEQLQRLQGGEAPQGYDAQTHELLCLSAWPTIDEAWLDERAEADFARLQALVGALREARAQAGVSPKEKLTLHAPQPLLDSFDADALELIQSLAGLARVQTAPAPAEGAIALTFEAQELALVGAAAAADRAAAVAKRLQELDASIQRLKARLANPSYVEKAPAHLVEQTRSELARLEQERDTAQQALGKGA
ncbi:MAG: hypothetical protein D6824_01110 [Planctomycetota bacterium]|nr:MAG: hypothetical protein D6824_01110 [Planctomycetota bacterium]